MVQKHFSKVSSRVFHSHCRKDENATIAYSPDKRAAVECAARCAYPHYSPGEQKRGRSVCIHHGSIEYLNNGPQLFPPPPYALQFPFVRPGDELAGLKTTRVAK